MVYEYDEIIFLKCMWWCSYDFGLFCGNMILTKFGKIFVINFVKIFFQYFLHDLGWKCLKKWKSYVKKKSMQWSVEMYVVIACCSFATVPQVGFMSGTTSSTLEETSPSPSHLPKNMEVQCPQSAWDRLRVVSVHVQPCGRGGFYVYGNVVFANATATFSQCD